MGAAPPETRLQAELEAPSARSGRVGPLDAFVLARKTWLSGRRVDMSAMARALGVNRVTLYRWVGSREQLLVELIWSFTVKTIERLEEDLDHRGSERIVQLVTGFLDATITNHGMKCWLTEEGEGAMRLLTRYDMGFQPRLIGLVESKLREQIALGEMRLGADTGEVAYVIEQLIESYVYRDIITGEPADARPAEPIFRMLLR